MNISQFTPSTLRNKLIPALNTFCRTTLQGAKLVEHTDSFVSTSLREKFDALYAAKREARRALAMMRDIAKTSGGKCSDRTLNMGRDYQRMVRTCRESEAKLLKELKDQGFSDEAIRLEIKKRALAEGYAYQNADKFCPRTRPDEKALEREFDKTPVRDLAIRRLIENVMFNHDDKIAEARKQIARKIVDYLDKFSLGNQFYNI